MVRNLFRRSPWLLTPTLALLAALPAGAAHAQSVPPDFEVTLTSAPRRPGGPPPETVTLRADGSAMVSARVKDGRPSRAKTIRVDAKAPSALLRLVEEERFFDLKPLYRAERVLDGDYAVLKVTSAGRTHEVKTVNVRLRPFDRVAVWVNSYFPPADMVLYNALLGVGEVVER